jgi:general stress protein 26
MADDKSPDEYEDRAWELVDRIQVSLFTTWTGDKQDQWPLTAISDRDAGVIEFLVSRQSGRYDHLEEFPAVTLGFADNGSAKYVVVDGHARLSDDRARIKSLWSPFAKAWWQSADDPDIRLLTVTAERAELWDSPGKLAATAVMLGAAVTGKRPATGDHGAVRL